MKEKIIRLLKITLLVIILLILYSCESKIYSPWEVVTTHQYEGHLYCCYFVDVDNGWAGGDFPGHIFRYTNGNWHNFPLPEFSNDYSSVGFCDIFFLSKDDGWIVGQGLLSGVGIRGVIAHWNGEKWEDRTPQPYSDVYPLYCVFFTSPDDGWAGSEGGRIYHYINGEWSLFDELPMNIYCLWFNSTNDGWAGGSPCTLYRWNGTEWYEEYSIPLADTIFKQIVFTSEDEGWLLEQLGVEGSKCYSKIYRYDSNNNHFDFSNYYSFSKIGFNSLSFSNPNDGWAMGIEYCWHWDGEKWTDVPTPELENMGLNLNDVFAISPDDVWAVGDWGTILHFTGWK